MKFINWLVNRYLIAGMMLTSIGLAVCVVIQLGFVVFNVNPFYESKKQNGSSWSIGTDYKSGIPVTIDVNSSNLADTSIDYITTKGNSGSFSINSDFKIELKKDDSIKRIDTISSKYAIHYWHDTVDLNDQKVCKLSFASFTVKVVPQSIYQRIVLMFPSIFLCLFISFTSWQLSKFLHCIQLGHAFKGTNYIRLRNIGLACLLFQLLLYVFDFVFHQYYIIINFNSTIPNWKSPFYLSGSPQANSSLSYIIIGCIFLIIAKAFKEGNQIQQEQDLTI